MRRLICPWINPPILNWGTAMKWWDQIEYHINTLINNVLKIAWFLVPSFAKPFVGKVCTKISNAWNGFNHGLNAIIQRIASLRHLIPNLLAFVMGKLLSYPTRFLDWAQNIPQEKLTPKHFLSLLKDYVIFGKYGIVTKIKGFINYVGVGAIIGTVAVVLLGTGSFFLFKHQIFPQLNQHYHFRQIASGEQVAARADYYLLAQRQFVLKTVELPIWFDHESKRKTMVADLAFVTSTRSAIYFFQKNELLVRDRISVYLERVQPMFPLSDEGKQVLCNKIQKELNTLLDEKQVGGEVSQVFISNLVFI